MAKRELIEVEHLRPAGSTYRVDAAKYAAMRKALIAVLPAKPPGMKVADARDALLPLLPADLFPGGAKAGWWIKCVQLDLEAKGILKREEKPVRLYRA